MGDYNNSAGSGSKSSTTSSLSTFSTSKGINLATLRKMLTSNDDGYIPGELFYHEHSSTPHETIDLSDWTYFITEETLGVVSRRLSNSCTSLNLHGLNSVVKIKGELSNQKSCWLRCPSTDPQWLLQIFSCCLRIVQNYDTWIYPT
jgi:hypothetical protein